MNRLAENDVIDYLVLGHITQDITPQGSHLGGTAAYASLLAHRMGLEVGLVTGASDKISLSRLEGVRIHKSSHHLTTTFENHYTTNKRVQYLSQIAPPLSYQDIPPSWRRAPIVHLAPVAKEIHHEMIHKFSDSFLGISLQGWLRQWDQNGKVSPSPLNFSLQTCPPTSAVILSLEDVGGEEDWVFRYARQCPLLIATRGKEGADIHIQGHVHHIPTSPKKELDPTGAGDIFGCALFIHYVKQGALLEAAQFATKLAAASVKRPGLKGVPSRTEIQSLQKVF
ncbi:MAG: hypothetical protein KGY46_00535 [Anaerolineales bacterium]|nr:hypothetical protein [Anaerolineales bacterium]